MNQTRGQHIGLDIAGLNTALAEASCQGLDIDVPARTLRLNLEVVTLGASGEPARDRAVTATFTGLSRVAASLRMQKWDDIEPTVLPLELADLSAAIASFGGGRLHGWEFIDLDDSGWALWRDLLSFDTTLDQRVCPHVLEFSQEEGIDPRELDVRVWFDSVTITDTDGTEIPLREFIAEGVQWWSAHHAGDPRTRHPNIAPSL